MNCFGRRGKMLYLKKLDERQKVLLYKCGYESFWLLIFMVLIELVLPEIKVNWFNGQMGLITMLYISWWYFSIRKAWFNCEVPDEKRRRNRIIMTATTVFLTIIGAYYFYYDILNGGISFVNADGVLNSRFVELLILLTFWIITGIKWYQKKMGFEEDN